MRHKGTITIQDDAKCVTRVTLPARMYFGNYKNANGNTINLF